MSFGQWDVAEMIKVGLAIYTSFDILQASLHCLCNFEGHIFQMAWFQDAGRLPNLYQT